MWSEDCCVVVEGVPVDEVVVVAWFGVDGGGAEVESVLMVEEDEGVEEEEKRKILMPFRWNLVRLEFQDLSLMSIMVSGIAGCFAQLNKEISHLKG